MEDEQDKEKGETSEELINQIELDVESVFSISKLTKHKKEWSFYEHLSHILIDYFIEIHQFNQEQIRKYTVYHALDSLLPHQKFLIIKGIYKDLEPVPKQSTIRQYIYNYFNERMLRSNNSRYKRAILSTDKSNQIILYAFDESIQEWEQAEPELMEFFKNDKKIQEFILPIDKLFKYIGFFSVVNSNQSVLKVIDMTKKRDTGARVNQGGKTKWLSLLNEILTKYPKKYRYEYTKENTISLSQSEISIIIEFIMRESNSNNNTIMFVSSEEMFFIKKTIENN
jgi:hypothetical protein